MKDFLKCIHYYASSYYHEEGILYDAGKEARAKKKTRKGNRSVQGMEGTEDETRKRGA